MVQVSYRRGPSGNDQPDAQDAELIIWHTLRYRFGGLVIVKTAGGCAGLVCVSESGVVARATYAQLAARFGPRPRGMDVTSGTSPIGFPGWAVALVVALAVAVLAAATVVMAMILRSNPALPGRPERRQQGHRARRRMRSIGRSAAEESDVREDDDEAMIPVVEIYDARAATLAASIGGEAGSVHSDRDRLYASSPHGRQSWDIQTG